jgi:predicted ATPase/transcriptional regulator with XRE-family HTH domain
LTQELLAERTGLSVRGISDLERGVHNLPQRATVLRLIEGLDLPGDEQAMLWAVTQRAPRPRLRPLETRWQFTSGDRATAVDPFVGRADELTAIMLALHEPDSRLLTLTGPPGVGKTRLAIEATRRLVALLPAEIVFVDLAPLRSPALVLPAIAAAIGLRESETPHLLARLQTRLAARPAVLVLDNFEHLLAAAPVVSDLLQASPEVRLLVTSREALRVRGEQELPVPPLATPPLAGEMRLRDVVAHEAVALFVLRARASDPDFQLSGENARAIAELCVRLDGLPLAIELAAARVKMLPPAAIVERLAQRLPVLATGSRDLPERQRTLADAIAWSYNLLTPDEQRLFRRLSVFLGGFTLQAAEAVATRGERDVFAGLASLHDKSLLARLPGRAGVVRFGMLETIREYGLERLAASGEEAYTREVHATHFLAFAEAAARDFREGAGQRAAIERLGDEHDNLRQALTWALVQSDPTLALRLTEALWRSWWIHGHVSEGQRWLDRALERGREAPAAARARALIAAGRLAWIRGALVSATERLEEALALGPDPFDRCEALNALGDVARERGDYARAEVALMDAMGVGRTHEDWFHLGASLHNLGIVAFEGEDYERAQALLEEGLAYARQVENRYLVYSALHYLSWLAFAQGDYARAAALRREDLAVQRELAPANAHGAARCLEGVALLAIVRNRPAPAARLLAAAAMLREGVEDVENAERQQISPWIATARERLGEEAFTSLWQAGRMLPLDVALAEAVSVLELWSDPVS